MPDREDHRTQPKRELFAEFGIDDSRVRDFENPAYRERVSALVHVITDGFSAHRTRQLTELIKLARTWERCR